MTEQQHVTAHDLSIHADLTYRQVDYWTRAGYLTPIYVEPAFRGSGYPRDYELDQIPLAKLMGQLTTAGLTPKAAYTTALALLADGRADIGPFTITIAGAA